MTGTRILVAAASRHGATTEIAQEIADVLRERLPTALVEVRDAAEPGDLAALDAAIVGSAVYLGRWLPAARHLVDSHRAELVKVPVWLFSSGPVGVPPQPAEELAAVTALGDSIGARGHQLFAGRLAPDELGWGERLTVRAVHAAPGDFRDHDAIRSWAVGIATELATTVAPEPPAGVA